MSCAEFPTHASHGWARLDLLTAARVHLVIHQSISLFISLTEQHLICDPLALILKVHFLLSSQYYLFPVIAVLNIFQLLFPRSLSYRGKYNSDSHPIIALRAALSVGAMCGASTSISSCGLHSSGVIFALVLEGSKKGGKAVLRKETGMTEVIRKGREKDEWMEYKCREE